MEMSYRIKKLPTPGKDLQSVKKALPLIGEWAKNFFMGKPNKIFPEEQLTKFLKDGKIDDGWRMFKGVTMNDGKMITQVVVEMIIKVEHSPFFPDEKE